MLKPFNALIFLLICALLLFGGCVSTGSVDTKYVGVSEYGMFQPTDGKQTYQYVTRMQKKGVVKLPMEQGDLFSISMLDMRFSHVFEGFFEERMSDKGNELGLFVTLKEGPGKDNKWLGDPKTLIENRLVFSSFSKNEHEKLNSYNTLIYRGEYTGGELICKVEVVEFDKQHFDLAASVAQEVYDTYAERAMGGANSRVISEFLDVVGSKIYDRLSRDDKILECNFRLVPTNYVVNNENENYFAQYGKLLITRVARCSPYATECAIPWNSITIREDRVLNTSEDKKNLSYLLLMIEKVNNANFAP